jgi:hypothetical protein
MRCGNREKRAAQQERGLQEGEFGEFAAQLKANQLQVEDAQKHLG